LRAKIIIAACKASNAAASGFDTNGILVLDEKGGQEALDSPTFCTILTGAII
jgi:hypothetical protein